MWPGYMTDELHIGYVTNGVHLPTWLESRMEAALRRYLWEGLLSTSGGPGDVGKNQAGSRSGNMEIEIGGASGH